MNPKRAANAQMGTAQPCIIQKPTAAPIQHQPTNQQHQHHTKEPTKTTSPAQTVDQIKPPLLDDGDSKYMGCEHFICPRCHTTMGHRITNPCPKPTTLVSKTDPNSAPLSTNCSIIEPNELYQCNRPDQQEHCPRGTNQAPAE
mmetsp:Transcript_3618/g.8016  ORF Transcript_3618/g.8016 Transcript_3618/m.8016 type:complete len:143 (-) Transcript_3618:2723-3151(-)